MTTKQVFSSDRWKLALPVFWFMFTFSMVSWWLYFSLEQLDSMSQGLPPGKYPGIRRMLLWEGSALLAFIFGGGVSLLILTNRERSRNLRLRLFFSNFSHDLKTSLNRLRLRAEVMAQSERGPELPKLLEEVSRLDLQLENSLWIARGDKQNLLKEEFSLGALLSGMRVEWPDLELRLNRDVRIRADQQAFQSIVRNIFQNAWSHGGATRVEIDCQELSREKVRVVFDDNGAGFAGDPQALGRSLMTSKDRKGNGIGLYLTKSLLERMRGRIEFPRTEKGFRVSIEIPGSLGVTG